MYSPCTALFEHLFACSVLLCRPRMLPRGSLSDALRPSAELKEIRPLSLCNEHVHAAAHARSLPLHHLACFPLFSPPFQSCAFPPLPAPRSLLSFLPLPLLRFSFSASCAPLLLPSSSFFSSPPPAGAARFRHARIGARLCIIEMVVWFVSFCCLHLFSCLVFIISRGSH